MDWSVVATAFVLGLIASLSCLGLCIPILVPFIMEKDKTLKEGLFTSIFFLIGRLIIYIAIGTTVFMIGSAAIERSPTIWLKITALILGFAVIIYGVWIIFKFSKPKWCPATLADNYRPMFSVILGLLIGSFFCWALWLMIGLAVLSGDFSTLLLSVIAFWIGSSVCIIAAGTVSGGVGGRWGRKIGTEKLRDVCGIVLILIGIIYLIRGAML